MTTATFDTLQYVKQLKAANVSEAQAEVQAEALRTVLDTALTEYAGQLATKEDVFAVKADVAKLDAKIDLVRSELRGEVSTLKWMFGFVLAGVASLVLKAYF